MLRHETAATILISRPSVERDKEKAFDSTLLSAYSVRCIRRLSVFFLPRSEMKIPLFPETVYHRVIINNKLVITKTDLPRAPLPRGRFVGRLHERLALLPLSLLGGKLVFLPLDKSVLNGYNKQQSWL